MRFMAMASVSCASLLIEPNDMAPVVKRLTISLAGSTSSSGTGVSLFFNFIRPRSVHRCAALLVDEIGVFLERLEALLPHRMLQFADGQRIQQVIFAVDALVIVAADGEFGLEFGQRTERVLVLQSAPHAPALPGQCLRAATSCRQSTYRPTFDSIRSLRKPALPDSSAESRSPSSRTFSASPS